MEPNPYAPPQANRVDPAPATAPALTRRQHLLGEATVKFAALIFMVKALGLISGWFIVRHLLNLEGMREVDVAMAGQGRVALIQVVVQSGALVITAVALWRLQFWARVPALILCLIGLRTDPGIVAYLLAIPSLVHPQAWRVLARAYRPVRLAAPALGRRSTGLALAMFLAFMAFNFVRALQFIRSAGGPAMAAESGPR